MRNRRWYSVLTLAVGVAALACGDRSKATVDLPVGPAPDSFRVVFETTRGAFVVEAHRAMAPVGVDRFYALTRAGFFDDNGFFRVVPGFVVQFGASGDPMTSAHWDSLHIADDPRIENNRRGTIAFAKDGPGSRATQLFINLADNTHLDRDGFAPFGRVVDGMGVVDSIYAGYREKPEYHLIATMGNAYLHRMFSKLDYIKTARIMKSH